MNYSKNITGKVISDILTFSSRQILHHPLTTKRFGNDLLKAPLFADLQIDVVTIHYSSG
jgi:hypothetical protein